MFALTEEIRNNRQESKRDIIELLFRLGHFISPQYPDKSDLALQSILYGVKESVIEDAVASYQRFIGAKVDGHFGPKTKEKLKQRWCSCPDRLPMGASKWPHNEVSIWLSDSNWNRVQGRTFNQAKSSFVEAIGWWNHVSGLNCRYVDDDGRPNVFAYFRPIDGRQGTLAWSMLPYNNITPSSQLEQRYDTGETWTDGTTSGIELIEVQGHELGHALGLPHSPDENALMYWAHNPNRSPGLNSTDVADIQALYGKNTDPIPDPVDPVDPTEPPDLSAYLRKDELKNLKLILEMEPSQ